MLITISSLSGLRVEAAAGGTLEVEPGTTVDAFLAGLDLEPGLRRHVPVVVNGELVERSYVLQEGDELILVLPPTGG